jgi:hypothetical protein
MSANSAPSSMSVRSCAPCATPDQRPREDTGAGAKLKHRAFRGFDLAGDEFGEPIARRNDRGHAQRIGKPGAEECERVGQSVDHMEQVAP